MEDDNILSRVLRFLYTPTLGVCATVNHQWREVILQLFQSKQVDFSEGTEAVPIPCKNQIDKCLIPTFLYINKVTSGSGIDLSRFNIYEGCDCEVEDCMSLPQEIQFDFSTDDFMALPLPKETTDAHKEGEQEQHCEEDHEQTQMHDVMLRGCPCIARIQMITHGTLRMPTFECNSRCKCSADCRTRIVQKGLSLPLQITRFPFKGWGVVSLENIPAQRFICEYTGEIISTPEAKRRLQEEYDPKRLNYLFIVREYIAARGTVLRTNVDATRKGNVARLFNHSCEPNMQIVLVRVDSFVPKLAFFAQKDIAAGEELTFDYGVVMGNSSSIPDDRRVKCYCGSSTCRGFLPFDPSV